jgi:hypothetical protein
LGTTYYYAVFGYNGDGVINLSSATFSTGVMTLPLPAEAGVMSSTTTTSQTHRVTLPGLGEVLLEFPSGAITRDGYVLVNTAAGTNPLGQTSGDIAVATGKLDKNKLVNGSLTELFLYDLYGSTQTGNFPVPVRLSIAYPDADNDGMVDGTVPPVAAGALKIFRFNAAERAWEQVPDSVVDVAACKVTANLAHFSLYAVVGVFPAQATLSQAFAYPNPYKPGSNGAFDRSAFGEGIVFQSLTARARIRIYNLAGELVRELMEDDGDGRCLWDARTADGKPQAVKGNPMLIIEKKYLKKVAEEKKEAERAARAKAKGAR